jgi:hypothetical protein
MSEVVSTMKQLVVHARESEDGAMAPAYVVAVTGQGAFADALRPEWEEAARRLEAELNGTKRRDRRSGPGRGTSPPL